MLHDVECAGHGAAGLDEVPAPERPRLLGLPHERPCAEPEPNGRRASSFECLWLQGGLKRDERPDLIGLVVAQTIHPQLGEAFDAVESREGAASSGGGHDVVERLARRWPVIIHAPDKHYPASFIGPRRHGRVQRFKGPSRLGGRFRALSKVMEARCG